MAFFDRFRARPPESPEAAALAKLKARLAETEKQPLMRLPAEDLSGDARDVAEGLNRRLDALSSSEKEQQQFIADVSHELRTPLTVLRGSLEVVLEEERTPEEYREAIGNALLEVRHLTRISQNLLFLTRGESGRVTLSFANLDLGRFASDTVRDLAPAAADRQMHLDVAVPPRAVYVFADSGRLQQVLHNLIENALQYSEPGGRIQVRRRVGARRGAALGLGHGRRDPARRPPVRLRAVLPEQALAARESRRVGPRALDRAVDRRGPQGPRDRRERSGKGFDLHGAPAGPLDRRPRSLEILRRHRTRRRATRRRVAPDAARHRLIPCARSGSRRASRFARPDSRNLIARRTEEQLRHPITSRPRCDPSTSSPPSALRSASSAEPSRR